MAQSSSALREPTMDEILTSIREIIEENTVQAAQLSKNDGKKQDAPVNHNSPRDRQTSASLSVDDAMRALAARIGLVEDEEKVEQPLQTNTAKAASADAVDVQKSLDERQTNLNKNTTETVSNQTTHSDADEDHSLIFSEAEEVATEALRPVISQWLKRQLPVLVERILREEISKSLKDYTH